MRLLRAEDRLAIGERHAHRLADRVRVFARERMKERAAHACHALCRARVVEEMQRRKGTRIAEHLKLVLSIIDRQGP